MTANCLRNGWGYNPIDKLSPDYSGDNMVQSLLNEIRRCRLCEADLPFGPRPTVQASETAKILVVGQAPGRLVHESGIPFNDPSGDRLRDWMGVDREIFYDASKIALLPMAFCFPGTGKSGDLPPPKKCAETWRQRLLDQMSNVKFTIVLGQYAINWHIQRLESFSERESMQKKETLTQVVKRWQDFWPEMIPLPHPSPRNNIWLRKNPWLEREIIPRLKSRISEALN